jgi:hypothetical protein
MQWVLGKRMGPPLAALASIVLMVAVAVLTLVGDGGANTPQLIMPGQLCPPIC